MEGGDKLSVGAASGSLVTFRVKLFERTMEEEREANRCSMTSVLLPCSGDGFEQRHEARRDQTSSERRGRLTRIMNRISSTQETESKPIIPIPGSPQNDHPSHSQNRVSARILQRPPVDILTRDLPLAAKHNDFPLRVTAGPQRAEPRNWPSPSAGQRSGPTARCLLSACWARSLARRRPAWLGAVLVRKDKGPC